MLNYHTDIILRIDLVLLSLYFIFASLLILYIILRDHRSETRTRKLLAIKQDLSRLFLSGEKTCAAAPLVSQSTHEEFIDVATNRRKYAVFFNESEQQLFKECFITADKVKALESSAKRDRNKWRRIEAIIALGYIQADSAIDILEGTLYSNDQDISYFSALAIGQISTMRSVNILMNFLKNRPYMRRKTASILENLSPDITDEVIRFADDLDPEVRVWAARLLSRSVSKQYVKKVEEMTADLSPEVRAAACESLAKLNDKAAKPLLIKCLKDDIWFVRMHAVRAISKIFGKESIPEIIDLLNDGSLYVLDSVRKALTDNIDAALPYMSKVFEGDYELSKRICIETIENSGCIIEILRNILSDNKNQRSLAIKILIAMVKANAHLGLETILKDMDEATRNMLLDIARTHDAGLAVHIEKILKNELNEL